MADELDIPMPSMMPAGAATWRNARRQGLDSSTRRLVLFAGVIGGGLLLLVGAWSLTGHRSAGVPVVEADPRPLRSKPENAGGMQLAGQDDAILSGTSGGQDGMAPPPESPAPQALAAEQAEAARAAAPVPDQAAAAPQASVPSSPVQAAPAAPAADPPAPVVARPAGGTQVQLAALVSEDLAKTEWQRLLHKMPDLLGGRSPQVSRLERGDGKVFFRLRTGGFTDIAQATSFCEKVRAKGGACSLGGA